MNIVYFLGAGFSKAWGLPTMDEFFDYSEKEESISEDDKVFLTSLMDDAYKAMNMLQIKRENLEDILSFCYANKGFDDEFYKRLCVILKNIYRSIGNNNEGLKDEGLLNCFKNSIANKCKEHNVTILTTNYDVIIEFMLFQLNVGCKLPNEVKHMKSEAIENLRNYGELYEEKTNSPILCKLHGSVNWFRGTTESVIANKDILYGEYFHDNGDEFGTVGRVLPYISCPEYNSNDVPLIIPPTFFKNNQIKHFEVLWNIAGDALKKANKIVFIGYSFPKADTHMKYFLGANLSGNSRLKTIDIIDINADNIRDELLHTSYGSHFKDLINPKNKRWQ